MSHLIKATFILVVTLASAACAKDESSSEVKCGGTAAGNTGSGQTADQAAYQQGVVAGGQTLDFNTFLAQAGYGTNTNVSQLSQHQLTAMFQALQQYQAAGYNMGLNGALLSTTDLAALYSAGAGYDATAAAAAGQYVPGNAQYSYDQGVYYQNDQGYYTVDNQGYFVDPQGQYYTDYSGSYYNADGGVYNNNGTAVAADVTQ